MTKHKKLTPLEAANVIRHANHGRVVLVLQGGGALGAYQGGVYQALHEAGIEPDWIIGTSIGAINAGIITGNRPEDRLPRLQEFWRRVERSTFWGAALASLPLTSLLAFVWLYLETGNAARRRRASSSIAGRSRDLERSHCSPHRRTWRSR